MGDIDRIEAARGGTFEFRYDGELVALSGPVGVSFQWVLAALHDARHLIDLHMPEWKRSAARDAWAAHHDLPSFQHAQRLCYLVDRYADSLTYDLHAHAGVDLIELWQARRWRTLLAIIDRLPATSSYAVAVSQDPEHSKMLADAIAQREIDDEAEPAGPSMATWSPEVDVLTALRDDVRHLEYVIRGVNGDKQAKVPALLPRPVTPMQRALKRAENERRQSKHESLVSRMLPHKARS